MRRMRRKGLPYPLVMSSLVLLGLGVMPHLTAQEGASLNDHWSFLGDFVYMRRTDVHNHTLVKNKHKSHDKCGCPHTTEINTEDLVHNFDFEPGYRVGLSYMINPKNSIEGNFLYLQPWHGEKKKHGHHNLSFPLSDQSYAPGFTHTDDAKAEYESHFWDAEVNYWRYSSPPRMNYFSGAAIIGARYFRWDEKLKLEMAKSGEKNSYIIHTHNRIFGFQVGADLQMNPTKWLSWEAFAKAGPFANQTDQSQFMGEEDDEVSLRKSKKEKREVGIFADVAAQVGVRLFEHFRLHAGYQFMFFSGLSLAPDQISHRVNSNAGKKDHTHGDAIIHGLFAGAVLSF